MSFIRRELDRIGAALRDPQSSNCRAELYAAQQALAWASEPVGFAAPYATIMGIQEAPIDCSERIRPPSS